MKYAPVMAAGLAILWSGSTAAAQSFSFPNFADVSPLTLNGDAVQNSNVLRITNNGNADTGSAWYTTPVSVAEGFDTQFQFLMTSAPEGLAFVIHSHPDGAATMGGNLWGLGYGFGNTSNPITNSLVIELDAIQDGFLTDSSGNEISIHTQGSLGNSENEGSSLGRVSPNTDFTNNAPHTIRVTYVPGTLEVYFNNLVDPLLSVPFTFEDGGTFVSGGDTGGLTLTDGLAWVGFTSTTSAGSNGHRAELRSWNWISQFAPPPCYVGNILQDTTGPHDVLKISDSIGGFFRTVRLFTGDPFSFDIEPPPGQANAPFLLLGTLGIADEATVTPTPWGDFCFPLTSVVDIGGFVAPYTLAIPPGLPLNASFTFQALMGTDPSDPNVIEVTNAVALDFTPGPAPTVTNVNPLSATVGGTITVTGDEFSMFATVDVGGIAVTPTILSENALEFAMPAGVPCDATLTVFNPDGSSSSIPFNPTPVINNVVNPSGTAAGGQSLIIIGTGFAPGTTVTVGGNPAIVSNATSGVVICTTPAGTVGPANVVITTPGGCSVTTTYTYI